MLVQKLLFLLDREAAEIVGGPHFRFVPYNYGPFDKGVYVAGHVKARNSGQASSAVTAVSVGWSVAVSG